MSVAPGVNAVYATGGRFAIRVAADEHFYGLGERFAGPDLRGHIFDGWTDDNPHPEQRTSYVATRPSCSRAAATGFCWTQRCDRPSISPPAIRAASSSTSRRLGCAR
ncbi:MAG: hypothetical protein ACREN2_12470 [Candidatus Dormibacteria bacterium]